MSGACCKVLLLPRRQLGPKHQVEAILQIKGDKPCEKLEVTSLLKGLVIGPGAFILAQLTVTKTKSHQE